MNFDSYADLGVMVAVDLVNTLTGGWARGRPVKPAFDDDVRRDRVLTAVPLSDQGLDRLDDAEVEGFDRLASQLRAVFEAAEKADTDTAAERVNGLLAEYQAAPHLARHDQQGWHLHFHSVSAGVADGWGARCAVALAIAVGSAGTDRLGVCHADACDRVFVDVSRNGSRRFCSAACLNRTKVSAFRARRPRQTG
jgi:predicted RNA-binding Zn ribbon-like protein